MINKYRFKRWVLEVAFSILNNVIGPIMPGSSSSHTARPYHIAKLFGGFAKKTMHKGAYPL